MLRQLGISARLNYLVHVMTTNLHEMVKKGVEAACRSRLVTVPDSVVIAEAMTSMHRVLVGKHIYVICKNYDQAWAFQKSLGLKVNFLSHPHNLYGLENVTIVYLTGTAYDLEIPKLVNIRVKNPDIWYIAEF